MSQQLVSPEGYEGFVEPHLPRVQNAIAKSLTLALKTLSNNTLKLNKPSLNTLAAMLVEFAADLHCEIGIWRSLERFNTEFFDAPLPFRFEQRTSLVRRLAKDHGIESIAAAFMLEAHNETYVLEYLLRRYKGRFYRPRYPTLTLAE
jgi:hypothetical protein